MRSDTSHSHRGFVRSDTSHSHRGFPSMLDEPLTSHSVCRGTSALTFHPYYYRTLEQVWMWFLFPFTHLSRVLGTFVHLYVFVIVFVCWMECKFVIARKVFCRKCLGSLTFYLWIFKDHLELESFFKIDCFGVYIYFCKLFLNVCKANTKKHFLFKQKKYSKYY